ncbi:MAG: carbohydrate binding domain-containing protein [Lachnospiraceae bacterium]|nr:carbohydrate binding domain-containing protein [Lachnospiraceae bacterium]
MKFKKLMGLLMVSALTVSSLAACGKESETNTEPTKEPTKAAEATPEPTKAPDPTAEPTKAPDPTPEPTAEPTPEPTKAPEVETVYNFDASAKSQSLYFQDRGGAYAKWFNEDGHDSEQCFFVTNRTSNWHGTSLSIDDQYIGKVLHVSYWAKHTNESPITISCTLQVNKPDGAQDWPERASMDAVPANEWTLIEADVPIYPEITGPMIYWEATETYDFYIDDVVVTVVDGAVAERHYEDVVVEDKSGVQSIGLTFNDDNLFFGKRGDGTPAIVAGGQDDDYCMEVTGRTANWNGAQVDLSAYNLAGRTIDVSYYAMVTEDTDVNVTLEENSDAGTAYNTIVASGNLTPGEWVYLTGTLVVGEATTKPVLYFESSSATASFKVDRVGISFDGAEVVFPEGGATSGETASSDAINLSFADGNMFFGNRGDGTPAIVAGGQDDDACMEVTGRTSNWHGAEVDLSSYNLAGRTINISYYVKSSEAVEVNVTLQEESPAGTGYNRVASSGVLTPDTWTQVNGTIVVGADTTKPVLYFESDSNTASFMVDVVSITFEGETASAGGATETTGGGANEVANVAVEPGAVVYYNSFENAEGNYLDGSNSYNYATNENAVGIAHGGNESVLVKSREYDNAGCGLRISSANGLNITDLTGRTVELSVWVYFEDGAYTVAPDTINFTIWNRQKKVDTDADGNAVYEIALEQVVNKGEWTQLVATMQLTDGIDNGMLLIGTQGEESATGYLSAYYMDEMQLKVIE